MSKREIWAAHVARWTASGLNLSEFAAKNGINQSTLRWWKDRLGFAAKEMQRGQATRAITKTSAASPLTFVELTDVGGDQIEIVLPSGVRVRVRRGFDAATLVQVLDALRN
jgi:hypothetical protein